MMLKKDKNDRSPLTAAMQCIAEEAGAIFKQMDGSAMTYNRKDSLNEKGFYIINHKSNLFV